jgi:hypothetical protein
MSGAATVFCSRCGAPGQTVESYCRSCGEWLPDPTAAWHPPGKLRRLSPEHKHRRMRALELLSAAAALVSGIVAVSVHGGASRGLLIIPIILCFAVVVWQAVAFFLGSSLQGRRVRGAAEGGTILPAAQGGSRPTLNSADTRDLVPRPSVTENTTALLDSIPTKKGGR